MWLTFCMLYFRPINDDTSRACADGAFNMMCSQGMEPNVTLHWFVHPAWFEHIGAFLKEQNIPIFVDWAKFAFSEFRMFYPLHLCSNIMQLLAQNKFCCCLCINQLIDCFN